MDETEPAALGQRRQSQIGDQLSQASPFAGGSQRGTRLPFSFMVD